METTLRHLTAGDIFQANICRRFEAAFSGDPLDVFCAGVETLAPAYAAFLRTPHGAVASLSPELFLRRSGRQVRTAPIKGTAPLSSDVEALITSAKDRAENVMIVDLMRNDLGRVCEPGTVRVEDIARAERHTGVWHLVSDVVGTLAAGEDDASLLRATFPPGSVTGAPKVRAMEVIHEVEATGRETYTGAVGYLSPCAGLELNVAIRTFEFAEGTVWLGAGGGVVADSTPDGELRETVVKVAPLAAAIGARLGPTEMRILATAIAATRETPLRRQPGGDPLPAPDREAGIFTTCLVADGRPVDLHRHLTRLGESVADVYGERLPTGTAERVVVAASRLRGPHRLRIAYVPGRPGAGEVRLTPTSLPAARRGPWRLVPVVVPGGLGGHKYADRNRLRLVEPAVGTWSTDCDPLLTDADGTLLETGRGNIFVVTDDAVHTPVLDGRLLPGVTRSRVIEELGRAGVDVVESNRLTLASLADATEVFVTGSLDRARAVTAVDGNGAWDPGPMAGWLGRRLQPGASHRPRPARRDPEGSPGRGMNVLLVDNYDSFVYNLDQYVRELGSHTRVVRNDALDLDEVVQAVGQGRLHGVVVSPGPGTPAEAGDSMGLIKRLAGSVPVLGVCLGHQCIAEVYGGRVVAAGSIVHGKRSLVYHDGAGVFAGLAGPLVAARYHSLVVSVGLLPVDLVATAHTAGGIVMGIRHRDYPVEGVQFHPESILSRDGHHLLGNFLRSCARMREARRPTESARRQHSVADIPG